MRNFSYSSQVCTPLHFPLPKIGTFCFSLATFGVFPFQMITIVALKFAMSSNFRLPKKKVELLVPTFSNWPWVYTFPCQKLALFVSPLPPLVSFLFKWSPLWWWNSQSVHAFLCKKKIGLLGCIYTYPDRSGYPDVSAPDRPSVYTKTIEVYAIRSNTLRYPELFENDFKGGSSGCLGALWRRVNGASGYPDVSAHALCGFLRLETVKAVFFFFFPQASKTSFHSQFLSCNSTIWFQSLPHNFINFESHFTCIDMTNFQLIHAI